MANDETWATLFELVIELEKAAADFYRGLAKQFSHVPKVSEFWGEMLVDELQHIQIAMSIRDSLTPSQLLDPVDLSLLRKARKAQELLDKGKLNPVRTLDDAYQLAHLLETSEATTVLDLLRVRFASFDKRKRFAVFETHHVNKLEDFSQTFGDAEWRKGIVTRDTGFRSDP